MWSMKHKKKKKCEGDDEEKKRKKKNADCKWKRDQAIPPAAFHESLSSFFFSFLHGNRKESLDDR
jgi:hypothetical protein